MYVGTSPLDIDNGELGKISKEQRDGEWHEYSLDGLHPLDPNEPACHLSYFEAEDLPGFANWFRIQAIEELTHGDKLFDYVCETGGRARVLAIYQLGFMGGAPIGTLSRTL